MNPETSFVVKHEDLFVEPNSDVQVKISVKEGGKYELFLQRTDGFQKSVRVTVTCVSKRTLKVLFSTNYSFTNKFQQHYQIPNDSVIKLAICNAHRTKVKVRVALNIPCDVCVLRNDYIFTTEQKKIFANLEEGLYKARIRHTSECPDQVIEATCNIGTDYEERVTVEDGVDFTTPFVAIRKGDENKFANIDMYCSLPQSRALQFSEFLIEVVRVQGSREMVLQYEKMLKELMSLKSVRGYDELKEIMEQSTEKLQRLLDLHIKLHIPSTRQIQQIELMLHNKRVHIRELEKLYTKFKALLEEAKKQEIDCLTNCDYSRLTICCRSLTRQASKLAKNDMQILGSQFESLLEECALFLERVEAQQIFREFASEVLQNMSKPISQDSTTINEVASQLRKAFAMNGDSEHVNFLLMEEYYRWNDQLNKMRVAIFEMKQQVEEMKEVMQERSMNNLRQYLEKHADTLSHLSEYQQAQRLLEHIVHESEQIAQAKQDRAAQMEVKQMEQPATCASFA